MSDDVLKMARDRPKATSFSLKKSMRDKIEHLADVENVTKSAMVEQLLTYGIEEYHRIKSNKKRRRTS